MTQVDLEDPLGPGFQGNNRVASAEVDEKPGHDGVESMKDFPKSVTYSPVHVQWKDLCYSVGAKRSKIPGAEKTESKSVLSSVSGEVRPGQLLAIMGSSGAGKTTLLNLLAGRLTSSYNVETAGQVLVNGKKRDYKEFKQISAYVEQHDHMYEVLTVEEQIRFAANLRLPKEKSSSYRENKTNEVISELGLKSVRKARVGGESKRGISGGERRRVSIGIELVTNPSLIFLDEPTSGLDSFNAMKVMQTLRSLAHEGRTIITTIHQPRSNVFGMFDQLLLLSKGTVMYFGPASQATKYFASLGHHCPPEYNPADFLVDLVSEDTRSDDKEEESQLRIATFARCFEDYHNGSGEVTSELKEEDDNYAEVDEKSIDSGRKFGSGWFSEFLYLCRRVATSMARQTGFNTLLVGAKVVMAVLLGLIWLGVGRDHRKAPTRATADALFGVLFFITINEAFDSAFSVAFDFPKERTIVLRERASGTYRVSSYIIAKTVIEVFRVLLLSTVFVAINYWLVGFRPDAWAFFEFIIVLFLTSWASQSLAICVAVRIAAMPLIY